MTPSEQFQLVQRLSKLLRELERMGIHVKIGDDFNEYRRHRSKQRDRGPIYPMFDIASSYIDSTNGFWVCGFSPDGALVHTQAVRLLDLANGTLDGHLRTHRQKYITPDTTPDPDATFYSGPKALRSISGRVCYHGEFWLHGRGLGGPRSQGATLLLSRLLLDVMVTTWAPAYVFALVPKKLAAKGAHLRYGYFHCEPGQWIGPDQQVTEEDHLIWMSAEALETMLSQDLPQQTSTDIAAIPLTKDLTSAPIPSLDPAGHG